MKYKLFEERLFLTGPLKNKTVYDSYEATDIEDALDLIHERKHTTQKTPLGNEYEVKEIKIKELT